MPSAIELVNTALRQAASRDPPITGAPPSFDDTTAGIAARYLYPEAVNTVARQFSWDFARNMVTLAASGNVGPFPMGFTLEYLYPSNGIEVWQLQPATIGDPHNPVPVNFAIGNAIVSEVQKKVIWTDLASARAIYNNNPLPELWDAAFAEAVVRYMASGFVMALGGRPETSGTLLQQASGMTESAKSRDG